MHIEIKAKDMAEMLAQTLVAGRVDFTFATRARCYAFHLPGIENIDTPDWLDVLEDFRIQHYERLSYRDSDGG